jgi:hypothetical protein
MAAFRLGAEMGVCIVLCRDLAFWTAPFQTSWQVPALNIYLWFVFFTLTVSQNIDNSVQ